MFSASKIAGASSGFQIANSLRFRKSASAYLNRTFGTPTNNKIWTYSLWVKRGLLGVEQELLNANSNASQFYFSSSDTLNFYDGTSGAAYYSTQVFRDPSSWYHIIVSVDTTQATAGNRVRIYLNGSQITAFTTGTAPTQNNASAYNIASTIHVIGRYNPTTINYFDGYLAEVNFIDGQALTPSSFGEIDAVTGVWKAKRYAGTYGTNGFKLNFSNGTSTTTLGYDSSGNGNNWTTNNISLTAGSTYDWMIDSPTKFPGSSYGVGNYAVLNPLNIGSASSLNSGNLNYNATSSSGSIFQSQITASFSITSAKYYWEVTPSLTSASGIALGVAKSTKLMTANPFASGVAGEIYVYIGTNGYKHNGVTSSAYGATYTTNDVIGVALDMDAGTIAFYKNNTSQGTAFSSISGSYMPFLVCSGSGETNAGSFNFGQRPFAYTPPSGYKSLCTQNLPVVTIQNGAAYMAATTYTGNGSTQTISGAAFQPDLVWVKCRSVANNHVLYDSVRGAGSGKALSSSLTAQEGLGTTDADSKYGYVSSLNSNGFSVAGGSLGQQYVNTSAATYIGWQWKAGGTAVTNTAGSITSSVSANTTSGFSVVTFTTNAGGSGTVGHGLGVAPSMVIIKSRTSSIQNWVVGHTSIAWTNYLLLNATVASSANSTVWNNTAPSSTVVTLGSGFTNASYGDCVAYCFAAIPGYSAFGSYTGNGSSDGPFVYCGFRPRWILVKRSDASGNWFIRDISRDPYNATIASIYPNLSDAEYSPANAYDILSNGFKVRTSASGNNGSGEVYVWAAFAENPFQNALAR